MSWRKLAGNEIRRRAVLAGRCVDANGQPLAQAYPLVLHAVPDDGRRRKANLRPGGAFFFLDVPAGRHALARLDDEGEIVQSLPVTVPKPSSQAKLPFVTVDFPIADPTQRKG
jgi:hypothetical protein